MLIEQWKPILDGTFEVSDLGRVRRARAGLRCDAIVGRILKPTLMKRHGYMQITLKRKTYRLAKLVAVAFLGPANGREVNHKDTIKTNDWLSNLEYLTKAEHEAHTQAHGLRLSGDANPSRRHPERMSRGTHRYNSKLTDDLVRMIRASPKTQRALAAELGVAHSLIAYVRTGRGWKHVTGDKDEKVDEVFTS